MMKINKFMYIVAAILIATSITACSSGKSDGNTAVNTDFYGKYTYCGKDSDVTSTVVLNENGTFVFTFSETSDYLGTGKYTLKGDVLTLKTDDGKYNYTFKTDNGTLVFDAENSSEQLWSGEFSDGSVFE